VIPGPAAVTRRHTFELRPGRIRLVNNAAVHGEPGRRAPKSISSALAPVARHRRAKSSRLG
jgi:hypothetical protein